MTICLLVERGKVVLARKSRKIGAGHLMPYGGKLDSGESYEMCAVRELCEESGVTVREEDLELSAVLDFHNFGRSGTVQHVRCRAYIIRQWEAGALVSTAEMSYPRLCSVSHPDVQKEMMPADKHWIPLVVTGRRIYGEFTHSPGYKELLGTWEIRDL